MRILRMRLLMAGAVPRRVGRSAGWPPWGQAQRREDRALITVWNTLRVGAARKWFSGRDASRRGMARRQPGLTAGGERARAMSAASKVAAREAGAAAVPDGPRSTLSRPGGG